MRMGKISYKIGGTPMQDLLNKIDRLLKEKKFFEVKNIVKDENAADLAVLFDELFGEVFGEKTEFMILFRLLPKIWRLKHLHI